MTVDDAVSALEAIGPAETYAERLEAGRRTWTARDLETIVLEATNVLAIIRSVDAATLEAGRRWYAIARRAIAATAPSITIGHAAAVAAAVSPGLAWASNVDALAVILEHRRSGRPLEDLAAERRIGIGKPGWRPWYHAVDVLERGPSALTGPKRLGFARGLETGGRTTAVAVDGHAALAAMIGPCSSRPGITSAPSMTGRRYDLTAAGYAVAARAAGLEPAQAQAVTWVAWRAIPTAGRA